MSEYTYNHYLAREYQKIMEQREREGVERTVRHCPMCGRIDPKGDCARGRYYKREGSGA